MATVPDSSEETSRIESIAERLRGLTGQFVQDVYPAAKSPDTTTICPNEINATTHHDPASFLPLFPRGVFHDRPKEVFFT